MSAADSPLASPLPRTSSLSSSSANAQHQSTSRSVTPATPIAPNSSSGTGSGSNSSNGGEAAATGQYPTRIGLSEEAFKNVVHGGSRPKTIQVSPDIFKDSSLRNDLVRLIIQYLQDEGYSISQMVLQDEANTKLNEQRADQSHVKRMRKAILDGDWPEVEKLCTRGIFSGHSSFLHAIYRQQFLEMVERSEYQNAFSFLTKRLKPLEHVNPDEFKDMCYVLTAKSVQDAPSFSTWEGSAARRKLVKHFQTLLDYEVTSSSLVQVPPTRLLELLRQAIAYQIEFSRYHPKVIPKIETLMQDYTSFVLPNACRTTLKGHTDSVKCVDWCGDEGLRIVSGSSDNTVRLWWTETGQCLGVLRGHLGRVWDVCASRDGNMVASASADGTVRIWNVSHEDLHLPVAASASSAALSAAGSQHLTGTSPVPAPAIDVAPYVDPSSLHERDPEVVQTFNLCRSVLSGTGGDLYSVKIHPGGNHVAFGGYDKVVHLYDLRSSTSAKTFVGHELSVSCVSFNSYGNLVISGSKDRTVRFWDIGSGLCVHTFSGGLGEVTSVESSSSGSQLVVAFKDNSNRLFDLRMMRPVRRFRGHQNTSKSFIRAGFGPTQDLIASGSEEGSIHIWDLKSGNVLQRLEGHSGVVYSARWNARQSLIASCSDDYTVKTWWYDDTRPVFIDNN
ncbi:WD-repeat protein [Capsaspora owczarzaki ATCC 30864]|uniref:WD-repeat protein n=1 Tax=Capsaspora owczarzaki (strain ATCC 30864) TaxID=595528 RepID=UPI0001FE459C|nr:WD-repeat protein [Capsaspora owczarzaki ATCC 30864]|eukprot:XP_004347572.1 WD-repeat protein [Capsaspora owczarzaki ATCC 30864]